MFLLLLECILHCFNQMLIVSYWHKKFINLIIEIHITFSHIGLIVTFLNFINLLLFSIKTTIRTTNAITIINASASASSPPIDPAISAIFDGGVQLVPSLDGMCSLKHSIHFESVAVTQYSASVTYFYI